MLGVVYNNEGQARWGLSNHPRQTACPAGQARRGRGVAAAVVVAKPLVHRGKPSLLYTSPFSDPIQLVWMVKKTQQLEQGQYDETPSSLSGW